eukprot:Hpha_TRINITY_DN16913_c1_g1::TRINITY_DN16913_c1_g1_i1::g.52081::m.52081
MKEFRTRVPPPRSPRGIREGRAVCYPATRMLGRTEQVRERGEGRVTGGTLSDKTGFDKSSTLMRRAAGYSHRDTRGQRDTVARGGYSRRDTHTVPSNNHREKVIISVLSRGKCVIGESWERGGEIALWVRKKRGTVRVVRIGSANLYPCTHIFAHSASEGEGEDPVETSEGEYSVERKGFALSSLSLGSSVADLLPLLCRYTPPTESSPTVTIPSPTSQTTGPGLEPSSSCSQHSASEQLSPQTISRGATRGFPPEHGYASQVIPAADRVHSLPRDALSTCPLALSRLVLPPPTRHLPHAAHTMHPYSAQPRQPSLGEHS